MEHEAAGLLRNDVHTRRLPWEHVSAHTQVRQIEPPCGTSKDLSSRTTGTPFFSVTSLGTYSKRLTLIGTTRSPWSFDLASTREATPINRTIPSAEAMPLANFVLFHVMPSSRILVISYCWRIPPLLDAAESESLYGWAGSHGSGVRLGCEPGAGSGNISPFAA